MGIESDRLGRLGVAGVVEEQELQPAGVPREDAEVDAAVDGSGTERKLRPAETLMSSPR